jgi:hypothetical protein
MEWLQWGKSSSQHQIKGWLCAELLKLENTHASIWNRIISDYKQQVGVIEGMKLVMGNSFKDSRGHTGVPHPMHGRLFVSPSKSSDVQIPQNEFTIPYLLFAYDVRRTTFQRHLLLDKSGSKLVEGRLISRRQIR